MRFLLTIIQDSSRCSFLYSPQLISTCASKFQLLPWRVDNYVWYGTCLRVVFCTERHYSHGSPRSSTAMSMWSTRLQAGLALLHVCSDARLETALYVLNIVDKCRKCRTQRDKKYQARPHIPAPFTALILYINTRTLAPWEELVCSQEDPVLFVSSLTLDDLRQRDVFYNFIYNIW